jgi:hypothetical protein
MIGAAGAAIAVPTEMARAAVAASPSAISLEESLALTVLVAQRDPERRSPFAGRWLLRLLEEDDQLTIEEIALDASALVGLGGPWTL